MDRVVVRLAGDSGDGMQLAGERFTAEAAAFGNDLATSPNFPAEIRAPQGTVAGVSSFQVQIADYDILTAGDRPDVLVAMNPAALCANLADVPITGMIVLDADEFTARNVTRAGYTRDPRTDGSLADYQVHEVAMATLTREAVAATGLGKKDAQRCRNMFALGLLSFMYGRSSEVTETFLRAKFAGAPAVAEANVLAFRAGWNYGETTEAFPTVQVAPAVLAPGTYRQITGNTALAYGLVTAQERSALPLLFGAYPITPASDVLHELTKHKNFGILTVQAEDEIAAVGAALGASFAGALGVTATSGPGLALKAETIGLGVMTELPMVVIDVQRGGPSTGLPTKTEQADLLQALHGRNGESPVPVLAPRSPSDCFDVVLEAARIALTYRTPVILLSDGAIANGSEPWPIPEIEDLPDLRVDFATSPNAPDGSESYWPYLRDPETLAREWAIPGTPGMEHRIGGLEKSDGNGAISYDPANHDRMVRLRRRKIAEIAVPEAVVDDPRGDADVLALGWGSTYGAIGAACRRIRRQGRSIAQVHLRHLNPLPPGLGDVLRRYERVVVPELNLGQLASILRSTYVLDVRSITKVTGMPFTAEELQLALTDSIEGTVPA
ncbi:2-oxoacid:acceptor oxidoreductase subunit alpha [Pseudonocardia sp. GCM10023141]|uniref:2-oxoacid:acceptor oxidoreductase subunit alpha n=1 Tax=Pseudonocardia sp. GCM10023141 TaxID=3252653 RepID=UPI003611A99A